jgi:hypothetical protein
MDFPHHIYSGPPIDDPALLDRLPAELVAILDKRNGLVALSGGFHLRGACTTPEWHSLRAAVEGPLALHRLFPEVRASDIPFAEEACGDQFLLRDGIVHRMASETGDVGSLELGLLPFLESVRDDGVATLNLEPLLAFLEAGQKLEPGQLLSVYPPFILAASEQGVSLKAVSSAERMIFLADLARQLHDLPDGAEITLKVEP